jgi:hypothetical protein
VFGHVGRHARSAVGMCSLPGNITVEIEATWKSVRESGRNLFELR